MENERAIPLPNGETLHVTFKDEFLDVIREAFELSPIDEVTDDDVRNYIYRSFENAVDGAITKN